MKVQFKHNCCCEYDKMLWHMLKWFESITEIKNFDSLFIDLLLKFLFY